MSWLPSSGPGAGDMWLLGLGQCMWASEQQILIQRYELVWSHHARVGPNRSRHPQPVHSRTCSQQSHFSTQQTHCRGVILVLSSTIMMLRVYIIVKVHLLCMTSIIMFFWMIIPKNFQFMYILSENCKLLICAL